SKGRHRSKEEWRVLVDRLIEKNLVSVEEQHLTLQVTEGGQSVLDGEAVQVVLEEARPVSSKRAAKHVSVEYDPMLFEALRRVRRSLADEAEVPPFVIFSDRTLMAMASAFPQTPEELLQIVGIGERKAEVYGEAILTAIRDYV